MCYLGENSGFIINVIFLASSFQQNNTFFLNYHNTVFALWNHTCLPEYMQNLVAIFTNGC